MPTISTTSRALLLLGAATFSSVQSAGAQTGITVYNDGRVLVRRTLPVAVPKGTSTQRVELGPVDPSSLVSLDQGVVINRALFDAAEDENAVLRRLVGRKLTVERAKQGGGTETFQVTLLGVDPDALPHAGRNGCLRQPGRRAPLSGRCGEHDAGGDADAHVGAGPEGPAARLVHRRGAVDGELRRDPRREGRAGRGQRGDQLADVQRHRRRDPAARGQRVARDARAGADVRARRTAWP